MRTSMWVTAYALPGIGHRIVWVGPTVRRIDAPALVVQGTEDRMVDPESSVLLARRRPDWELALLDGLAHIPHVEQPRRTADIIGRWIAAGTGGPWRT